MDVVALTRQLVDIESITENEESCGLFLLEVLGGLVETYGGRLERLDVEPGRFNVFACFGDTPVVTYSTHFDTVPPFIPSSEDDDHVYGRGSCDAKGILASMIYGVETLLREGRAGLALLFVVGEERGSAGAYAAAKTPRGSKFVINGEPTENRLALGSKGALRLEIIAQGKMAHSAYPELGDSAIEKLLSALERIRRISWPVDPVLGPCTANIGTLSGGRAPNVIPDEAKAEMLIRLVGNADEVRQLVKQAAGDEVQVVEVLCIDAVHMTALSGFDTTSVAYTTDIPAFEGAWGEPFLLGPGTIHVAHTPHERISKADLHKAVELYAEIGRKLLA